jgi:hypothetical protein
LRSWSPAQPERHPGANTRPSRTARPRPDRAPPVERHRVRRLGSSTDSRPGAPPAARARLDRQRPLEVGATDSLWQRSTGTRTQVASTAQRRQAEDLAQLEQQLVLFARVAVGLEHVDLREHVERPAAAAAPRGTAPARREHAARPWRSSSIACWPAPEAAW